MEINRIVRLAFVLAALWALQLFGCGDDSGGGDAGTDSGRYWREVPSSRTVAVEMTRSPRATFIWSDPAVPTRMKVSAPMRASSSTAIAAEGQPMPVEVTETLIPSTSPV